MDCNQKGLLIGLSIIVRVICSLLNGHPRSFHGIGDHVQNLREDILIHRIRYSLTTVDQDEDMREALLDEASRSLEQ